MNVRATLLKGRKSFSHYVLPERFSDGGCFYPTLLETGGHSFELEVNQSGAKQTMQFTVDKNAKVQGNVRVGTAVTVEYAIEEGQNMALTVIAEG